MKRKALFFIPPTCGGAERVTITVAKLLINNGLNIEFAIVGQQGGDIEKFIPGECALHYVNIKNIMDFTTLKIYSLLGKVKPDVVFSSLCYINSRVALAAHLRKGVKVIIRNNNNYFTEKNLVTKLLRRWCYPFADEIIMQTEEMRDEFVNFFLAKCKSIRVIHNPIDTDAIVRKTKNVENPFDDKFKNYVYVGRITEVKGVDFLISTFVKFHNDYPDSRLYIIGKVEKKDKFCNSVIEYVKKEGLESSIIFVGFTANPYQYVNYADSLILASRNEGLPNVVLEAMYLRCPVIVTRSIPIIDRIVSPERGIVIDVDDEAGLYKAMSDILTYKITTRYQSDSEKMFVELF